MTAKGGMILAFAELFLKNKMKQNVTIQVNLSSIILKHYKKVWKEYYTFSFILQLQCHSRFNITQKKKKKFISFTTSKLYKQQQSNKNIYVHIFSFFLSKLLDFMCWRKYYYFAYLR